VRVAFVFALTVVGLVVWRVSASTDYFRSWRLK